jgi:hypothetical protein
MITATTTIRQRAVLWLVRSVMTLGLLAFAASAALDRRLPTPLWVVAVLGISLAWFSYLSISRSSGQPRRAGS